ncbi:putative transcriptional regulator [Calothrix sp. NIES-4101]|nr:putative transcriptional regulator [Calothrix sp. NIES-4101]
MNTDSGFNYRSHSEASQPGLDENVVKHTNDLTGAMDMVKRDRFELLSAYLDGEVTATERKQIEEWLANDPSSQKLYNRLLKLRHGLRTLPIPQPEVSVETTVEKVLERLQRRRLRLASIFGGTAIAACVLGSISGLLNGETSRFQFAQRPIEQVKEQLKSSPIQPEVTSSSLMVAINGPVIPIPKTEKLEPKNFNKQQTPNHDNSLY